MAKAALISAVPPLMLKTAANPGGLPIEVFDGIRLGSIADRSQLYKDLASGHSLRPTGPAPEFPKACDRLVGSG